MTLGWVPPTLAHQGGWDELAFVALPIALFAGLLALANRRATRSIDRPGAGEEGDEGDGPDEG